MTKFKDMLFVEAILVVHVRSFFAPAHLDFPSPLSIVSHSANMMTSINCFPQADHDQTLSSFEYN